MMLFEELAELQHMIHNILLPRMREPNILVSTGAVAQVKEQGRQIKIIHQ